MAVKSAVMMKINETSHFERENDRIDKYTLADELPAKLSKLGLGPREMAKQPSYTIRTIREHDKGKVLDFLQRFFFRDEPMNRAVQLLETPETRCLELEDYVCGSLDDNISVAAIDDKGDFVGIIINGIAKKEENIPDDSKIEGCTNPRFKRILKVLEHLDIHARIWEKVPAECTTLVEVRVASTHSAWRGRGLMRALCDETERLARNLGATALRMDATSAYSAAAAERLQYRCVYSILYSDLPFAPQPPAPHLEARVYVKEL